MSASSDFNSDPENIPIPANRGESFDAEKWLDKYMKSIGRKIKSQRPWKFREEIKEPSIPENLSASVLESFDHKPSLTGGYPHAPGVEFRTINNDASIQNPYGHTVAGGNSYFMAIALLIYGRAELWYIVRAQHYEWFDRVINAEDHPRLVLYLNLNMHATGSRQLNLGSRLWLPDCWVDHRFIQQVTADLYGILLVVFESPDGTNRITNVKALGDFDTPHKFLLFNNGTTYNPLIPAISQPESYRLPEINLANTKYEPGISDVTDPALDGPSHPWRTPIRGEPAPQALVPTPVTTIGPVSRETLEAVLWLNIHAEVDGDFSTLEEKKLAAAKKLVQYYAKKDSKKEAAIKAESSGIGSHAYSHDGEKKAKVENEADGERKKMKKQVRIDQKKVKVTSAAPAATRSNRKETTKAGKKAETVVLPQPQSKRGNVKNEHNNKGPKALESTSATKSTKLQKRVSASSSYIAKLEIEDTLDIKTCKAKAGPRTMTSDKTQSKTVMHRFEEADGIFTETIISTTTRTITSIRVSTPPSNSDPISPEQSNWEALGRAMPAKRIREEMAKRKPDVQIPWNMKAEEIKQRYGPVLTALDAEMNPKRENPKTKKRLRRQDKALESLEAGESRKKARRATTETTDKTDATTATIENLQEGQDVNHGQAASTDADGETDPKERKRRIREGKKKAI